MRGNYREPLRRKFENMDLSWKGFKLDENKRGTFSIEIPEEMVDQLRAEGWNVIEKYDNYADQKWYKLNIKINYDHEPVPEIYMVVEGKKSELLSPENVGKLDACQIIKNEFWVQQSYYNRSGNEGYSAYLLRGYFVIDEADMMISQYDYNFETEQLNNDGDMPFK